ncbi:MAG: HNH endonuclease [Verrucomicrobiaceae bacterium]|nr:MAG: HNH endonuclease [Verrucomicrobiaceae bacterium]
MPRKRIRHSRPRTVTSHRVPPKPASWDCPKGNCRYCGEPVIENGKVNTRKHWHPFCVDIWLIMNQPSSARKFMLRRKNHTCQGCGWHYVGGRFEVDHIKPLFEANGDPTYWQPANLMLLCSDCHKKKTKEDMIRFRALKSAPVCDDPSED